jgi:hypothetical protein
VFNELVLIATKEGHVLLRIDWIRSVADGVDGVTRVNYGSDEHYYTIEVAWSTERIYRAVREVNDAS